MNHYYTRINNRDLTITGKSLEDAIIHHFATLAREAGVGNAAGYQLKSVTLQPGPTNSTIGGKPYTMLVIDARGYDLAHEPASDTPKRTTIYFEGCHVESAHELRLKAY